MKYPVILLSNVFIYIINIMKKLNENIVLLHLSILTLVLTASFTQTEQKTKSDLGKINTEEITYEGHIKTIIDNYCVSCHSGGYPAANLSLETYESVRQATEKGRLLKRINNEEFPMPPHALMSEKKRDLIAEWAKQGFLEKSQQDLLKQTSDNMITFTPPNIGAINIDNQGFEFFKKMQGHWVGKMNLMGQDIPWFAFDYRAISPSHIHGIFEGGTMGNLFTSFFIANFKGTTTIMVRNGGLLNGIYRTSYFVLDKVENFDKESYYRFVDAYGGQDIMWIDIRFKGDNNIEFNSYTSRFGSLTKPEKHMIFTAKKMNMDLSKKSARIVKFPQNIIEKDFSKGLPKPIWGKEYPVVTSASYLWQDTSLPVEDMAKLSGDPYKINEIPYLSSLKVNINTKNQSEDIHVFFSKNPLTDKKGKLLLEQNYLKESIMNEILLFSEIKQSKDFTFTYLHPGEYYVTAFIDKNEDFIPSKGDISNQSQKITIKPSSKESIILKPIIIEN